MTDDFTPEATQGQWVPPSDVEGLTVSADHDCVDLRWRLSPDVDEVRVTRSHTGRRIDSDPRPQLRIETEGTSARDQSVSPGEIYEYKVCALKRVVRDDQEELISSPGVVSQIRIPRRPEAIGSLEVVKVRRDGEMGVSITWRKPTSGRVLIYLRNGGISPETVRWQVMHLASFEKERELIGSKVAAATDHYEGQQHIEWLGLKRTIDQKDQLTWSLTAVTELDDHYVIGPYTSVNLVDDIQIASIEERLDWQLLKLSWPAGANFLAVWHVNTGDPAEREPNTLVDRNHYREYGGVALNLTCFEQDVLVCGVLKWDNQTVYGDKRRLPYLGRWLLDYSVEYGRSRWWKRYAKLKLQLERDGWPDLEFSLFAKVDGFPLDTNGAKLIAEGRMQRSIMNGSTGPEFSLSHAVTDSAQFRLVVNPASTPGSAMSLDPTLVIVRDPMKPKVQPGERLNRPSALCTRCLNSLTDGQQFFRCEGSCSATIDQEYWQFRYPGLPFDRGNAVKAMPVFATSFPQNTAGIGGASAPHSRAVCPACEQASQQQVCGNCHSDLPQDWWARDVLGIAVVGESGSGKTTYLQMLLRHLERNLLPLMGGSLTPVDESSQRKFKAMVAGADGSADNRTQSAHVNSDVLDPMIADIGRDPKKWIRTISLFDVSGEDMATSEGIRPYSPALSRAHMIVFLIDPLQLDGIRDWVPSNWLPPQNDISPALIVSNVAKQIRARLKITSRRPVPVRAAVAFSKFDRIQDAAKDQSSRLNALIGPGNALWRDPYPINSTLYDEADGRRVCDEVRALLIDVGESATVSAVEQEFEEVQYFALSSLGHDPTQDRNIAKIHWASPQRVGDPLRWRMWLNGWMPSEHSRVVAGRRIAGTNFDGNGSSYGRH